MDVVGIIAAGGRGRRLGAPLPKALLELGGTSLLQRSVDAFEAASCVRQIVVVLPEAWMDHPASEVRTSKPVQRVAGGPRRQDSVARGFACVPSSAEIVVVHDAARPFVTPALIERTVQAAAAAGAAIAALPVQDTVKEATSARDTSRPAAGQSEDELGRPVWVRRTLPREAIYLAQTPQAFRREVLEAALALADRGVEATDEAMLAELAGHRVRLVDGDPRNLKITTATDLAYARWLVDAGSEAAAVRVGIGYDVHRLVTGRPLVLGGVVIPFDRGPAGHSDGDVVCHAIIDAMLGAANAGDIGTHFPDTDDAWRGVASVELLRRAAQVVQDRGLRVANVDVVVILERPKLAPHVAAMRAALAAALALEPARVSVKGKTHEGLGSLGRGEAVAAHAVALLAASR